MMHLLRHPPGLRICKQTDNGDYHRNHNTQSVIRIMRHEEFWRRIHGAIEDLLGGISFDEFLENPWHHVGLLADESSGYGTLAAISKPIRPRQRSEVNIHPADKRVDLKMISDTAQHVLRTRAVTMSECPLEHFSNYKLH